MLWEQYSKTDGYAPIFHTSKIVVLLKNWGKLLSQEKRTQPLLKGRHVVQSWLVNYARNMPGAIERVFPLIKGERHLRRNSLPYIDLCSLPSKGITVGAAAAILQPGGKGQNSTELLLGAARD